MGTPDGVMAPTEDLVDKTISDGRARATDIDNHITASAILGDITEVDSP